MNTWHYYEENEILDYKIEGLGLGTDRHTTKPYHKGSIF